MGRLRALEDGVLVFLFAVLFLLSVGQIALRNAFVQTMPWADPLVRHLVMWVGLWGALIATREDRHLSIEALKPFIPQKIAGPLQRVLHAFSALVCGLLCWHSIRFVAQEKSYATKAFQDVDAWVLQLVFPLVFSLMTIRYAKRMLKKPVHSQPFQPLADSP